MIYRNHRNRLLSIYHRWPLQHTIAMDFCGASPSSGAAGRGPRGPRIHGKWNGRVQGDGCMACAPRIVRLFANVGADVIHWAYGVSPKSFMRDAHNSRKYDAWTSQQPMSMPKFLATRLLWDGLSQLVGARSRSVFLNLLFGKQLENGKFTTRDLVIWHGEFPRPELSLHVGLSVASAQTVPGGASATSAGRPLNSNGQRWAAQLRAGAEAGGAEGDECHGGTPRTLEWQEGFIIGSVLGYLF